MNTKSSHSFDVVDATTPEDIKTFCDVIGYKPTSEFRAIKATWNGETTAMVGYDKWTLNAVEVHIWISDFGKACRDRILFREMFRFPFEIGGRGLVIACTPAHNSASLRLQKFLGFVEKYRIQDGWAIGEDLVISELRKQNCIWMRPSNNGTG